MKKNPHNNRIKFLAHRVVFCLALTFSISGRAQLYHSGGKTYLEVDPKLIRAVIAYSQVSLDMDTVARRNASFFYLKNEARIFSAFMSAKNKFAVRDAFSLDLGLGKLTSTPLAYSRSPERKFCVTASFGYEFLAGYRNDRFALMGGAAALWFCSFIGESSMPGEKLFTGYFPLMARGEYRIGSGEEFRIVLTAWNNFKKEKNYSGASLDLPFSKKRRFFLTCEYRHYTSDAAPATYDNYKYASGKLNQWQIGLKVGSIY